MTAKSLPFAIQSAGLWKDNSRNENRNQRNQERNVNGYKPIYAREERKWHLYRFSIGRRSFFLFYKNRAFFYDPTWRSPLGKMTSIGFMRTVKNDRFTIKATILCFILNFIAQMIRMWKLIIWLYNILYNEIIILSRKNTLLFESV